MQSLTHRLRRTLLGFLALPATIILGFVVLAEAVDWLDNHAGTRQAWGPIRIWLSQYVGDTQSAIGVLTAIAGSLFTVTSVTFSILLLAVQQGATVLNSQIVDHYLRSRSNRAWFGFFVGVSVFVLITLVQTTHTKAPIFGVTVSTLLGAAALTALVVLIYATVDQTRPSTVLQSIAQAALAARERQQDLLRQTAAAVQSVDQLEPAGVRIVSPQSGYLVAINVSKLAHHLTADPTARLTFAQSIGAYVPQGAPLMYLSGASTTAESQMFALHALTLSHERNVTSDPGFSLDHIATIGWTAISTAHSDPAVGAIAIHATQQLLHAWSAPAERADATCQIFYEDQIPEQAMSALESFIIAATESRQHQTMALILQALATSLAVVPLAQKARMADMVGLIAHGLGEHLPSKALQTSAVTLLAALEASDAPDQAQALGVAIKRRLHSKQDA